MFNFGALFLQTQSNDSQIVVRMKKVMTLAFIVAATLALSSCGTAEKCPSYSSIDVPAQQG
jgi:outer membrane protein assembly factor BamE (lipoprotein component of BamABCDE complex)